MNGLLKRNYLNTRNEIITRKHYKRNKTICTGIFIPSSISIVYNMGSVMSMVFKGPIMPIVIILWIFILLGFAGLVGFIVWMLI